MRIALSLRRKITRELQYQECHVNKTRAGVEKCVGVGHVTSWENPVSCLVRDRRMFDRRTYFGQFDELRFVS